jgi:HEPN domain-containing protein
MASRFDDWYRQAEAENAIQLAEAILEYCRHQID